jgi:hypothetical protein
MTEEPERRNGTKFTTSSKIAFSHPKEVRKSSSSLQYLLPKSLLTPPHATSKASKEKSYTLFFLLVFLQQDVDKRDQGN